MKRTILIQLAVAAIALAVVAPVLAAQDNPETDGIVDVIVRAHAELFEQSAAHPTEQDPVPMISNGLCSLTQSDISDIINHYDLSPNMTALIAAVQTPFNCGAYGQLCSTLTPTQAHVYACSTWNNLKQHKPILDVHTAANSILSQWALNCEVTDATELFCEEACDPHDVFHCNSIKVNGECKPLAICTDIAELDIRFFEFLTPF